MIQLCQPCECTGCGACASKCPVDAIYFLRSNQGFYLTEINYEKCIECHMCQMVCPIISKAVIESPIIEAYMAKNIDSSSRMKSASGAIFPLFAEETLKRGGVVYGASSFEGVFPKHIRIEKLEEIEKIRGSKYVQSKTDIIFRTVRTDCEAGRLVLFSGTPCEIYGLKKYLSKSYDNLLTIDIVCHGVISMNVLDKYIREKGFHPDNVKINWTGKNYGWHNREIILYNKISNRIVSSEIYNSSSIGVVYTNNVCLNECCYRCRYKSRNSAADITIGDFWGIENIEPNFDDDIGVSIVLIHSEKGSKNFFAIKQNLNFRQAIYEDVTNEQFALSMPAKKLIDSNLAFEILNLKGLKVLQNKTKRISFYKKAIKKVKNLFSK